MNGKVIRPVIITLFLMMMTPSFVLGQNSDAACRAFVNRVFADLGINCAGLESNELCYGYGVLDSTFYVDGIPLVPSEDMGVLVEAGDQTSLVNSVENSTVENVSGIQFLEPDRPNEEGEWGIAIANIQANLPAQLDGNGAIFMLFGELTIENAVLPGDVFLLDGILDVEVDNASIFTQPPGYPIDSSEIVDTVSGSFEADAISPDGAWVRVFFLYDTTYGQSATAWLQTTDLVDNPDLSALPVLGADDFAPMQNFYLESSSSLPDCDLVPPNGLLIQGPEDIETDIIVNEVPIRITSTIFLDKLGPRSLRMSVLSGIAQINPGASDAVVVPAGADAVICLTEELDLGIDQQADDRRYDPECGIEGPFVFGTPGSSISNAILTRLRALTNFPGNLLNYNIPNIRIIRASGAGGPRIEIAIDPPEQAQRIRDLCDQGLIPGRICDFLQ